MAAENRDQARSAGRDRLAALPANVMERGAAVAVADSAPVSLLMGTVGCLIGSAVGAAAWAAVAYYLNFEVAYLAIGVGVLAGGGMMIGARGHAGATTGAIAALAAIVAILIGKYIVVSYVIDEYVRDADIADVLKLLSLKRRVNIALASDLSGKVTVNLYEVTFEDALDALVSEWAAAQAGDDALRRLQAANVPAGLVLRASEVLADEQLVDRGYFLYLDHVEAGRRAYDGSGFHLSRSSAEPKRAAPLLGEHTFEIATDVLGLTPEEIGDLVVEQVLY